MERTLDLRNVENLLQRKQTLPSSEELTNMIYNAELQVIVMKGNPDSKLIETGWFLHSIGFNKLLNEQYEKDTINKCIEVSATIFDNLLQNKHHYNFDLLQYCFAAQVSFFATDAYSNASAIFSRDKIGAAPQEDLAQLSQCAMWCATALLAGMFHQVKNSSNKYLNEIAQVYENQDIVDINKTKLRGHVLIIEATQKIATSLISGNLQIIDDAIESISAYLETDPLSGEHTERWVAFHLREIATSFRNTSIWTLLAGVVPSDVLTSFACASPSIVNMWPSQKEILLGPNGYFTTDNQNYFISMPTSSGKTLTAQIIIAEHALTKETDVCYVAPSRALCREVKNSICARLRMFGKKVIVNSSEEPTFDFTSQTKHVEVMTPERLNYLLRKDAESFFNRFGLIIFDEAQSINEGSRGWLLEGAISFINTELAKRDGKLLLLSSSIGNKGIISSWMASGERAISYCQSEWKPTRRISSLWTTRPLWNEAKDIKTRSKKYDYERLVPLKGVLAIRSPNDKRLELTTKETIGNLCFGVKEGKTKRIPAKSTTQYKLLTGIIQKLNESGSVLVICATQPNCLNLAKHLAKNSTDLEKQPVALLNQIKTNLGESHPLYECVQKGIAYHHGALPRDIRIAIENAIKLGDINCIISTTTLADGVNLPVRSVVIESQGSHTADGYQKYITGAKLINAIGRAGRAGKETSGFVVLAYNKKELEDGFNELNPLLNATQITSYLAVEESISALEIIVAAGENIQQEILTTKSGPLSDFATFCLLLLDSNVGHELHESKKHLNEFLKSTLAWAQLDNTLKEKWALLADAVATLYVEETPYRRRILSQTGLAIPSSLVMDEIATRLTERYGAKDFTLNEAIDAICSEGCIEKLLNLAECPSTRFITQRRKGAEVSYNLADLIKHWVNGDTYAQISTELFSTIGDVEFRFEQLSNLINKLMTVFLPQAIGAISMVWNTRKEDGLVGCSFPNNFAAFIRYGVKNTSELTLVSSGGCSRSLAQRVATNFYVKTDETSRITQWLGTLPLSQWRNEFNAEDYEMEALLRFTQNSREYTYSLISDKTIRIQLGFDVANENLGVVEYYFQKENDIYSTLIIRKDGRDILNILGGLQTELHDYITNEIPVVMKIVIENEVPFLELNLE